MMNKSLSIYIHIPFCKSKCYYCNFISGKYNCETQNKYFKILNKEIINKSKIFKNKIIKSIYFGGGTPSSVNFNKIKKILFNIKNNYLISNNCEITIECNPNSISKNKLINYLNLGINRISFGVQTLNDNTLKIIGRTHTSQQAVKAIKMAGKVGFKNISADLLLGLPDLTCDDHINEIDKLINLGITHISAYMLIVENGTPLCRKIEDKAIILPEDNRVVDTYNAVVKHLKSRNFDRYEISNFCKKSMQCVHNLVYWQMGDYIGFGVAAHSFYNGKRLSHSNNIMEYIAKTSENIELINNEEQIEEYIMLGLRTKYGIDIMKLKKYYNYDILSEKKEEIEFLKKHNLINVTKSKITIQNNAFGVSNQIILKLVK